MKKIYFGLIILIFTISACSGPKECIIDESNQKLSIGPLCESDEECIDYFSDVHGGKYTTECSKTQFNVWTSPNGRNLACNINEECFDELIPSYVPEFKDSKLHKGATQVIKCNNNLCEVTDGYDKYLQIIGLQPAQLLSEYCIGPTDLPCIDRAVISSEEIQISLRNSLGYDIQLSDMTSDLCSGFGVAKIIGNNIPKGEFLEELVVPNRGLFTILIGNCNNGVTGNSFKSTIEIKYSNVESGLVHNEQVKLLGSVN